MWVLDHLDDIDADFLAIYHIDLEQADMAGPRYFALAYRLTAYQGVLAAQQEADRDERPMTSTTPTRTSSTAAPAQGGASETTELSLTQFRAKFPGLVSVSQGG